MELYAKQSTKVLVVGQTPNTNALMLSKMIKTKIPVTNITALTRLDANRAIAQFAAAKKVSPSEVNQLVVWGNGLSETVFADTSMVTVGQQPRANPSHDEQFIKQIQQREKSVMDQLKSGVKAMSMAKAAADHMRDWWCGKCST